MTLRSGLRRRSRAWAILAIVAALGCTDRGPAQPSTVLVVGVDGFEWDVLLPLVRQGEVPTLARLMADGRYGLLETSEPTLSPIIWTTIATGKGADRHGVRGFVRKRQVEVWRLYNSLDRKTKAFWNVLSDYGKRVAVIGWWMTYPVEPVNGLMVAQVNTLDQVGRKQGRALNKGGLVEGLEDQVHPRRRLDEMLAVHRRIESEMATINRRTFGDPELPPGRLAERLWENTQWALRADATYLEIAAQVAGEGWDLLAVYLGGADVVGHRFWRYFRPQEFDHTPTAEEIAKLGRLIPDYYRFIDRGVARILREMPPETTVLIVTDHGMHAVNRRRRFDPDSLPKNLNSGHHRRAPAGVLIAAGPGIARQEAPDRLEDLERAQLTGGASIFDVAPTLLTLLGVPAGADMRGHALTGWLDLPTPPGPQVPTHDDPEWLAARAALDPAGIEPKEERLEQLRALGYIE